MIKQPLVSCSWCHYKAIWPPSSSSSSSPPPAKIVSFLLFYKNVYRITCMFAWFVKHLRNCLDRSPLFFWKQPASSTGKQSGAVKWHTLICAVWVLRPTAAGESCNFLPGLTLKVATQPSTQEKSHFWGMCSNPWLAIECAVIMWECRVTQIKSSLMFCSEQLMIV